jgi:hypothetical protein
MSAAKASPSRPLSVLVSRALKTVGVVVILAIPLNIFIQAVPYTFDRQWQLGVVTQIVEQGIFPLVGIALFLMGAWIDNIAGLTEAGKSKVQDMRFWVSVLASLLGLLYLVLFPLHLNNVRLENQAAVEQVSQQATQAETELNNRLNAEIASQRQQITLLLSATDEQIAQLIQEQRLSQEQADLVRRFKQDPKAIEPFLKQREEQIRNQFQAEISQKRQQAEQTRQRSSLKSGLQVGLSSLLLAIGFIIVGWTGLKYLGQL